MLGYYTVVYKVDGDNAMHDEWWRSIQPLFMTDGQPISVTAISKADEMTRLDRIREIAERRRDDCHDTIDEILEALDRIDVAERT